ncbi:MAG: hypothetical protein M3Y67_00500, partial [Pseudomonadota bacterium]|nr:hypothetical protein [Pseudomonadota bacterium]
MSRLGNKLVLGRAQAEHYVSVQIEAAGSGSRGVVAVSNLQLAHDSQSKVQANADHWLARLPAGTRLLSHMESRDGGKLSRHLVAANTQDEALNRERLVGLLAGEGFALERESPADDALLLRSSSAGVAASRLLFFKGEGKEAIAT